MPAKSRTSKRPAGDQQGWGMLVFESFSAGAVAVLVALVLALVLVGLYDYLVWPLTKWDMTEVNPETFFTWSKYGLEAIFAGGTAAGFWCFTGAAFRKRGTLQGRR